MRSSCEINCLHIQAFKKYLRNEKKKRLKRLFSLLVRKNIFSTHIKVLSLK